ncbi:VENN motif pre-toxin domain-containing protein [Escherichia coli]|nr:VENN motif pre-toxin domain-containing protein [Escherichia coli]
MLFNKEVEKNLAESGFGTGGKYTRAMQAATAAVQGVMGGDLKVALANGAAPFIANEIKKQIPDEEADANLKRTIAHGIANAALALAKGENVVAQATGAMTGEAIGILAEYIYNKQPGELTEREKENVSAWATLASGLAGGLAGGDTQSVANAAQAGKTTVENNYLHAKQITTWLDKYAEASSDKERAELVEIANSVDKEQQQKAFDTLISKEHLEKQKSELATLINSNSCNDDCKRIAQYSIEQLNPITENYSELQRGNNIPRAAVATITLALPVLSKPLAPSVSRWIGSTTLTNRVTGAGISGLANLGMQGYNIYENPNTEFSFTNFGTSLATGIITPGMGYWGTTTTNTIGAGVSSMIDGQSPWASMGGAFVGSTVGYGGTKWITNTLDNKFNPWSRGLKERPFVVMPSMTAPPSVSPMPGIIGNSLGSAGSEYLNKETGEVLKKITTENENESN